jgi:hypothetical protein
MTDMVIDIEESLIGITYDEKGWKNPIIIGEEDETNTGTI